MAPERPRVLVILDLANPVDGSGTVYHWDPVDASSELVVLWEAERCPADFLEAPEGVVCIAVPPGYTEYRYQLRHQPFADPLALSWRGQVRGSALMVVAILPRGYLFAEPRQGSDWPVKAKLVADRMAIYWFFGGGDATVEPAWRMALAARPGQLAECCATINEHPSPSPPPEPPVPPGPVRREWAEQRAEPIAGPPPFRAPQYICYVRRARLDELFAQIDAETLAAPRPDDALTQLSFGHPDAGAEDPRAARATLSRLALVLRYLRKTVRIGDLGAIVESKGKLDCDWYSVTLDARATAWDPSSPAIYLEGPVGRWTLVLSCVKSEFSGLNREHDTYIPTSTNRFLFEGRLALPLEGLVRLVGADAATSTLSGSPLYLVVNPLRVDLGALGDVAL